MKMVWVYYKNQLAPIHEDLFDAQILAEMYPEAIYFYAGIEPVPLED